MKRGTSAESHKRYSITVVVNAVALICFVPFTNTSILVPFHLIAIFVVSVVVVYKALNEPDIILETVKRIAGDEVAFLMQIPFNTPVDVSPIERPIVDALRKYSTFPLNSTNQVPPLAEIKPLV